MSKQGTKKISLIIFLTPEVQEALSISSKQKGLSKSDTVVEFVEEALMNEGLLI